MKRVLLTREAAMASGTPPENHSMSLYICRRRRGEGYMVEKVEGRWEYRGREGAGEGGGKVVRRARKGRESI